MPRKNYYKPKDPNNKRIEKTWTEELIMAILDEVENVLLTDSSQFHYGWQIIKRGLPIQTLNDWEHHNPTVKQKMDYIRSISEHKLVSDMCQRQGKSNLVAGIFVLKSKFGYIEKEKDKALNIQEQQVKNEKIKIGFVDDEEDSDGNSDQ